jgi:hypothetical protein
MTIGYTNSGNENLHPSWMRWTLPSIADLIFISLFCLLAFTPLSTRLLGDAGIGWHIRTGQLIMATHSIPRVDPFSSTMVGQPWFAWEWLYDVVVGALDRAAGLNGVVVFTALIIAITFSWTFRLLLSRGTNFLVALVLVLLAASAAMIHFLARPHVLSWLFTVIWFCILDSSRKSDEKSNDGPLKVFRRSNRSLWLLPPLMLVWANVHGGFLLGFVLLAIYGLDAAWRWFRLTQDHKQDHFEDALEKIRAGNRARNLAGIGLLTALATFVNPYGWKLHLHIYRYLSNRFLMDHIDEFQSPNFHGVAQKCFAVLLLLTLVALAVSPRDEQGRRTSLAHGLVLLFAVYSGLYASRNIPVSALLIILVIGPRLSNAYQRLAATLTKRNASRYQPPSSRHFLERMQTIESIVGGHLLPIAAIVLTCWIAFHGGKLGSTPLMAAHFDSKRFPVTAVSYLEEQNFGEPVLTPDYWGGYLIYRLYPQTKVVIDDRHDLYGEEFLKSYLKMMHVEPGWQDFIGEHNVHLILVPRDSALANILRETGNWKAMSEDDVAVTFARPR